MKSLGLCPVGLEKDNIVVLKNVSFMQSRKSAVSLKLGKIGRIG